MTALAPNDLRAVIFDFDGTLIDSFNAHLAAYLEMFARLGMEISRERLMTAYTPDWYKVYRALGLPEQVWNRADAYWLEAAARHEPDLFPEVADMLTRLADRYLLGIVTSGERFRVGGDLARTGIGGFFATVITGDDVSEAKPHPQGLEIALALLGLPASQALYVGDTEADWQMARAAGVAFAGIAGPMLPDDVPLRLAGPKDLIETLELA